MFMRYASQHQGQAPTSEKALKDFINTISTKELAGMELNNVDQIFISPIDSKPFIVKYGLKESTSGRNGNDPGKSPRQNAIQTSSQPNTALLAAESSGTKRYVLFVTGEVQQLNEETVLKLLE
jgi:hypothetical protein